MRQQRVHHGRGGAVVAVAVVGVLDDSAAHEARAVHRLGVAQPAVQQQQREREDSLHGSEVFGVQCVRETW